MIRSKGFCDILRNEIDEGFKKDSMVEIIKSFFKLIIIIMFALVGYLPNKINVFKNSDNSFIKFMVDISELVERDNKFKSLFWIVIIASFLFCLYRMIKKIKNFNRKINIITLFTFGNTQFIFDRKLSRKHEIKSYKLNLSREMNSIKKYDEISKIILIQDREIEKFKNQKIDDDSILGFAGIGHTPLIFRAGYKIGDDTYFNLFHKYRDGEEFKYLSKIDETSLYESLKISKFNPEKYSDELIVILETTFEVKKHELSLLNPDNKNIIRFSLENKGFDVINNRTQIDEYVNLINTEVRQLVKENNIKVVHMILSTSAAMTFALGISMSSHYDANTIVYHYQNCYPWGIDIFKEVDDCVVITKDNN